MPHIRFAQASAVSGGKNWWTAYGDASWSAAVRLIGLAGDNVVSKVIDIARNTRGGKGAIIGGAAGGGGGYLYKRLKHHRDYYRQ